MQLQWLGHFSVKIKILGKFVYINPYAGEEYNDIADLILVSSFTYDKCSLEKIKRIRGDDTVIVGTSEVSSEIEGCRTVKIGEIGTVDDFKVIVTSEFGFILEANGERIFYVGTNEYLETMKGIVADVMIIPVAGNVNKAVEIVEKLKPKSVIPIGYGMHQGTEDDALLFQELVENLGIDVRVLKVGEIVDT